MTSQAPSSTSIPPRACYPQIEVRAGAMTLFMSAFEVFPSLAQKYLVEGGYATVLPGQKPHPTRHFIPLDAWLGIFDAVLADIGPNVLFKIGQRITGNPHFPATVYDMESAFRVADVAYHMSHRKDGKFMYDSAKGTMLEGIGHYRVNRNGREKRIAIECDTPYPCALDHGMMSGIAWHFEARAVIVHDEPERCRAKGGDRCTYLVTW